MPSISRSVHAAASPDVVYRYLVDFENATEWDANTVRCTRQSGDGSVGSIYENVSTFRGKEQTVRYELVQADPARQIQLRGSNKFLEVTDTMTLTSAAGGTRVDYSADFAFQGLLVLASPFMGGPLKKLGDDAERSLTAALAKL